MGVFSRFRPAVETSDRLDKARELEQSAAEHMQRNEFRLAKVDLKMAVGLATESASLRAQLCMVLTHLGEFDDALKEIDAAIQLSPHDGSFSVLRGKVLEKLSRDQEAAQVSNGSGDVGYADAPSQAGSFAASDFESLPGPTRSFGQIALPRTQANQIGELEFDIARDPTNSKLRRDLSILYLQVGRLADAKEQARKAEELRAKRGPGVRYADWHAISATCARTDASSVQPAAPAFSSICSGPVAPAITVHTEA